MEKSFLFKETTARSGAPILRSKNFDPATTDATHTFKPVLRRGGTATTFQIPVRKDTVRTIHNLRNSHFYEWFLP